jgi:hypothetical protein
MAIVQNNEVSVSNSGTRGKLAVLTVFSGTSLIIGLILFRWTGFPGQRSVWDIVLQSFIFGLLMAIFRPCFFSEIHGEVLKKTSKHA